jgi:hypothetical protein
MEIPESEADWRYALVGRVKGDQILWGNLFKDKTLLWQTTVTEYGRHGQVSFPTPGPAALAFNIAFESAHAARAMKSQIVFAGRGRDAKSIEAASIPMLFAYFEQAMTSAVFSFQCLEAYANRVISNSVTAPMEVSRRRGPEMLAPEELERNLSTEEKLDFVLPRTLAVRSPKGTKIWPLYRDLKEVRDSTVHLKSADQYVRGRLDRESVYHRLLNRDPIDFPRTAAKVVRHFCSSSPERWLEAAEHRLKNAAKGSGLTGARSRRRSARS